MVHIIPHPIEPQIIPISFAIIDDRDEMKSV
jgi:hypothetical protein